MYNNVAAKGREDKMVFAAYRAMKIMRERQLRRFVTLNVPTRHLKPSFRNFRAKDVLSAVNGKVPLQARAPDPVIKIYVCGMKFYVDLSVLLNYPDTLLGSEDLQDYYNRDLGCYFFDRNKKAFKAIIEWYKTGVLSCPSTMEVRAFERELDFFRIDAKKEAKCVAPVMMIQTRTEEEWPMWQRNIYYVVAEPSNGLMSKAWAIIDTFFILCSIVLFIAETQPFFKEKLTVQGSFWEAVFFWGDGVCVTFFLFDFIIRMIVWPDKARFIKSVTTWLDFLAIVPFFLMISLNFGTEEGVPAGKGQFVALKVLRLMRITRLLKLARHSDQLILIVTVLRKSGEEMTIMALLWVISTVTFGSIMYYVEAEYAESKIVSITTACWWTVATMSTVGFGDITPVSGVGKFLGSIVVFLSMVFMAMPMTLIVGKFSAAYEEMEEKKVLENNKQNNEK